MIQREQHYCRDCDKPTTFDNSGYCNSCGRHYDNVARESSFKVIVFGGRDYNDPKRLEHILDVTLKYKKNIQVVCGKARGADSFGEVWARKRGHDVKYFPADWNKYGRGAGPIRNEEMAQYLLHCQSCGDEVGAIGFWDERSKGTRDMKERLENYKIKLKIIKY